MDDFPCHRACDTCIYMMKAKKKKKINPLQNCSLMTLAFIYPMETDVQRDYIIHQSQIVSKNPKLRSTDSKASFHYDAVIHTNAHT